MHDFGWELVLLKQAHKTTEWNAIKSKMATLSQFSEFS